MKDWMKTYTQEEIEQRVAEIKARIIEANVD